MTIQPLEKGVYALSPYPFAPDAAEFAFAGRQIRPREKGASRELARDTQADAYGVGALSPRSGRTHCVMVREFSFVTSLAGPALSRHGDAHRQ